MVELFESCLDVFDGEGAAAEVVVGVGRVLEVQHPGFVGRRHGDAVACPEGL